MYMGVIRKTGIVIALSIAIYIGLSLLPRNESAVLMTNGEIACLDNRQGREGLLVSCLTGYTDEEALSVNK